MKSPGCKPTSNAFKYYVYSLFEKLTFRIEIQLKSHSAKLKVTTDNLSNKN